MSSKDTGACATPATASVALHFRRRDGVMAEVDRRWFESRADAVGYLVERWCAGIGPLHSDETERLFAMMALHSRISTRPVWQRLACKLDLGLAEDGDLFWVDDACCAKHARAQAVDVGLKLESATDLRCPDRVSGAEIAALVT